MMTGLLWLSNENAVHNSKNETATRNEKWERIATAREIARDERDKQSGAQGLTKEGSDWPDREG
jgi:hypothetical protein